MANSDSSTTTLSVEPREAGGSRDTRRLRRTGRVPGIIYGGEGDNVCFHADARELRNALAHGGAVIELSLGGETTPVVVKDEQRDPVRGELIHLDLLRVRLDRAIHATTVIELVGGDDAPGVKEGGVLEQVTHEINIEALPASIPDAISHDVSTLAMHDVVLLSAVTAPAGVTFLDDVEETVVATLTPPRLSVEPTEEIEAETEVVGEGEAKADAAAEGGSGDQSA